MNATYFCTSYISFTRRIPGRDRLPILEAVVGDSSSHSRYSSTKLVRWATVWPHNENQTPTVIVCYAVRIQFWLSVAVGGGTLRKPPYSRQVQSPLLVALYHHSFTQNHPKFNENGDLKIHPSPALNVDDLQTQGSG